VEGINSIVSEDNDVALELGDERPDVEDELAELIVDALRTRRAFYSQNRLN